MALDYKIMGEMYIDDIKNQKTQRCKEFDRILKQLFYKQMRIFACGASRTSLCIDVEGNIYPCHRFMDDNDFLIGNIKNHSSDVDDTLKSVEGINVMNITGCNKCWARFLCGGACMHTRMKSNNIYIAPEDHCEVYKGIYELAIYIYYILKEWDPQIFNRLFRYKSEISKKLL